MTVKEVSSTNFFVIIWAWDNMKPKMEEHNGHQNINTGMCSRTCLEYLCSERDSCYDIAKHTKCTRVQWWHGETWTHFQVTKVTLPSNAAPATPTAALTNGASPTTYAVSSTATFQFYFQNIVLQFFDLLGENKTEDDDDTSEPKTLYSAQREMAKPVPIKAFLRSCSQGSWHVHGTPCWNLPTSPYPTIFASANPIMKTGCAYNMRPKLHDECTCHQ